jgi:5'-3' exonuclease
MITGNNLRKQRRGEPLHPSNKTEDIVLNLPVIDRRVEQYICPHDEKGWKSRYYRELFGVVHVSGVKVKVEDSSIVREIARNYVEAFEWTHQYYRKGCIDWNWHYKYNYAPLLEDVLSIIMEKIGGGDGNGSATTNTSTATTTTTTTTTTTLSWFGGDGDGGIASEPVPALTQLAYVLPRSSQGALPVNVRRLLRKYLDAKYPVETECKWAWAYCKYFWESHAQLPELSIGEIERCLGKEV